MPAKKLNQGFFNRPADQVAPELIGCTLIWKKGKKMIRSKIVETEAYLGEQDKACHAFRGKTARTEIMYREASTAYVYMVYGMYFMLNVVCEKKGTPHAVLIRAAQCISHPQLLLNGPGKLCRELGISKEQNGQKMTSKELHILEKTFQHPIKKSPRVGIHYAQEWRKKPLRFFDPSSHFVSRPPRL